MTNVQIIKANGQAEAFDRSKLEYSLRRSGASTPTIKKIIEHVELELKDGMTTSQIYDHAFFLLHKIEQPIAPRYSLRRAIMDLGPTGFPFEDYVGEIFKSRGYTVLTGQIVQGKCVEHEVDLVAYNDTKLIMGEVKFHNEAGLRSDLKVALYVKARFDDLAGVEFTKYGKPRTLDEGWLITNTKFTSTAIEYGMCNRIHMVGWNYPSKGNLQELIEDADLHPITCLKSLSLGNAQALAKEEVVLCKTLAEKPELLDSLGLSEQEKHAVLEEVKAL